MKGSQVSTVDLLLGEIRREFPYVEADGNGKPRIFFENAAGSLVLKRAAEAESKARLSCSANTGGPSWESKKNEETILEGRKSVRDFLNAPSEQCIVSGESASSLFFNLSYALSREMSGDENIILTDYDHYANISPWQELERRHVVKEVRFTRYNPKDGMLDTSHLARSWANGPLMRFRRLSAIMSEKQLDLAIISNQNSVYYYLIATQNWPMRENRHYGYS